MQDVELTPTSYIVLGLVDWAREATPYQLKQLVAGGLANLWSVPHAQLYTEPERLAGAGYLEGRQEAGGRRRRTYTMTDRGRQALRAWLATPMHGVTELRDPGLLQLFFGAPVGPLAQVQHDLHRRKLEEYEWVEAQSARGMQPIPLPEGPRLVLEAGIAHEREWVRFWGRLAKRGPVKP